jgi:uncharacterized membrane protein YeaQ/YmgE (transglycosylase-associated protein family)
MTLLVTLALCVPVGWIATLLMTRDLRRLQARYFLVGIGGALIGAWGLAPALGFSPLSEWGFSVAGPLVSLASAIICLAAASLARRVLSTALRGSLQQLPGKD